MLTNSTISSNNTLNNSFTSDNILNGQKILDDTSRILEETPRRMLRTTSPLHSHSIRAMSRYSTNTFILT